MRGRPPKPTVLKILAGNPGRRPLPKNEPKPKAKAPPCPVWLSKDAKAEWKRIVPELQRLGLLTIVDRAALSAYCQAWAELQWATAVLDDEGRVIDEPVYARNGEQTGERKKAHPAVKLQRDAMTRVKQYLNEFGLSPASRSKVSGAGGEQKEEADPLTELKRRGQKKA